MNSANEFYNNVCNISCFFLMLWVTAPCHVSSCRSALLSNATASQSRRLYLIVCNIAVLCHRHRRESPLLWSWSPPNCRTFWQFAKRPNDDDLPIGTFVRLLNRLRVSRLDVPIGQRHVRLWSLAVRRRYSLSRNKALSDAVTCADVLRLSPDSGRRSRQGADR